MLKKLLVLTLVSFFTLSSNIVFAKDVKSNVVDKNKKKTRKIKINGTMGEMTSKLIIKAEGLYLMGDNDTPAYAREMCLVNAKKTAAENAMSKIKSETVVINGVLEKDEIKVNADADVSVVNTEYLPVVNNEYKVKIEAEVTINNIPQKNEVNEVQINEEDSLKVFVSTSRSDYYESEKMAFTVSTTKDAYLRVKYKSVDGDIIQLLPNKYQKDNFIKGGEEIELPSNLGKNYNFEVIEPFGEELLIVEASEKAFKVDYEDKTLDGKIKIVGNSDDNVQICRTVVKINTAKNGEGSSKKKKK